MRKSGLLNSTVLALALATVPVLAGCGNNPFTPPEDPGGGLPIETPPADSPQNLLIRFEAIYERQVIAEYQKLFTRNFRFTFSNSTDDSLATRYSGDNGWNKDDEIESTSHLFTGFTDEGGTFHGPAASIELSFPGAQFFDDPARPDSAAFYKYVLAPRVLLNIVISGGIGEEYAIDAQQDFYLVRGDIAPLDAGQEARADRWYIYRWDDKAVESTGSAVLRLATHDAGAGAVSTTWGQLKANYVQAP